MDDFKPHKFERYTTYVNEPIDRLVVNRFLQRLFEDIEKKMDRSKMTLNPSTETTYGTVKFSSASAYDFYGNPSTEESSANYYDNILTISLLNDYSKSLSDSVSSSIFWSPSSTSHTTADSNKYWVKTDYCNVDFSYFPNGVNCITGTMELGFNNILTTFGNDTEVLSGDIMFPHEVSGYGTYMNITDEDVSNLNDYINYSSFEDRNDVKNLTKLDGVRVIVPFVNNCEATLKHNICNWTTYSSFKQSFVELHYTTKIDIKSLYEQKYGKGSFEVYNRKNSIIDKTDVDYRKFKHPCITFEQKPIIMMQVGFYGGDTDCVKPIFGHDNTPSCDTETVTSEFYEYDTLTEQPLTKNEENSELSPVNGFVMLKKYENEYDDDGFVTNNIINFDVIMKFMVGSAADPKMIYGLTSMNSRAKVQFALIGV